MADSLSVRRERTLRRIVPTVVPSVYGSKAFRSIDANWEPGKGYTTCGGLPAYVAQQLGVTLAQRKQGIGSYGLAGLRNAGIINRAWVHVSTRDRTLQHRRPRPGDFYMLCSGGKHEYGCCRIAPPDGSNKPYLGAKVEHVGVIVDAETALWKTADAGQGYPIQEAKYVLRHFNSATGEMTGEQNRQGRPMRRLCGWLDLDAFPFLT